MAKTSKTAAKSAAKTVRRAPRQAAAAQPPASPPAAKPAETSLYEVLQPFKFVGVVVKPPEWVEMTADDAREYQEAGVLGSEEMDPEPFRGRDGDDADDAADTAAE